MLLISRKFSESIRIGDDVIVTITSLGRGRVQFGIVAPKSVPVHRSEVYDKNKAKEAQDEQNNQ